MAETFAMKGTLCAAGKIFRLFLLGLGPILGHVSFGILWAIASCTLRREVGHLAGKTQWGKPLMWTLVLSGQRAEVYIKAWT